MAPRRPDTETLAAIRDHWARYHGGELPDDAIGMARKGRVPEGIWITVIPETPASPAWFVCHACAPHARRYRVDVGADPKRPPARHITAIQRHFQQAHGVRLEPSQIYHDPEVPARAVYGPTTPILGAHLVCELCPVGLNRIYFEEPPYGDARSFSELTMLYPELSRQVGGLDAHARAVRLEAHHRGIDAAATQPAITRALRRARQGTPARRLTETQQGIQRLLSAEVRAGAPVTNVIDELAAMARSDPVAYAVRIARHIPSMRDELSQPPEVIAKTLVDFWFFGHSRG